MVPASHSLLRVPIAPGELLDKITILEIKQTRLADPGQRANVSVELSLLRQARTEALVEPMELPPLVAELKMVNERLWDVEDALRQHEQDGDFGSGFIALARSVYHLNDQRAFLKRRINELCGSLLREEKSYRCSPNAAPSSTPPVAEIPATAPRPRTPSEDKEPKNAE